MKAWPAYVEEVDENDQVKPGTRITARAPTTEYKSDNNSKSTPVHGKEGSRQSEAKIKDIKPDEKPSRMSKRLTAPVNIAPLNIPQPQAYPSASMAGSYDPYYYGMPPPHEVPPHYFPPPHDTYGIMINDYSQPFNDNYAIPTDIYGPPHPIPSMPPISTYYQYPQMPQVALTYNHSQQSPTYVRYPAPPAPPAPAPAPLQDYTYPPSRIASRSLASRFQAREQTWDRPFDPITRTMSAFGTRDIPRQRSKTLDGGDYESVKEGLILRNRAFDRKSEIRASTPLSHDRLSRESMSGSFLPREHLPQGYQPREPVSSKPVFPENSRARRPSVSFDLRHKDDRAKYEPPANTSRRKKSWYDQHMPESSIDYESKLRMASSYQEEANRPEAQTIKRLHKRQDASSRATKSSASRDGSDFRRSETRTNRSGSPNEDQNMTIKVITGSARVTLGGAQIDCSEGGAIEIKRDKCLRDNSRRPSLECISVEPAIEDRVQRVRSERHQGRSRVNSRSYRQSSYDDDYDCEPHY